MGLEEIAGNIDVDLEILQHGVSEKDATVIGKLIMLMKKSPRSNIFNKLIEIIPKRGNSI